MRTGIACIVLAGALGMPRLAAAQPADIPLVEDAQPMAEAQPGEGDAAPAETETEPAAESLPLHHEHQGNVRLTFGTGYRFVVPYDDSHLCGPGADDTSPCESRAPWFLDIDAGFGASERIELSIMLRVGLESEDINDATPLVLGPGIRIYPSPDSRVKLFLGFRVLLDFTDVGPRPPEGEVQAKTDVAVRGEPGLQVEINRWVGVFLQTGVTFGAVRWFHFEADGGLGLQARFP